MGASLRMYISFTVFYTTLTQMAATWHLQLNQQFFYMWSMISRAKRKGKEKIQLYELYYS